MLIYTPPRPAKTIPIIDLGGTHDSGGARAAEAAAAIHRACRETGFFYVANHDIASALIADQFAAAQRFFDLPQAEKSALDMKNSASRAGYEPIGAQKLDSQDANAPVAPVDLKESYYCGMDLPDDHPFAQRRQRSFGHNQWPASYPDFKPQMVTYYAAMSVLGARLLKLLALSLDVAPNWFAPAYEMPSATLRLIKYPPQPDNAAFNQIGAGAHTDWGGVTILAQDDCGGLEVRNVEGDWIEAKPVPGTFVINLGDLMARWTNGLYRSNLHRVKNNVSGRDRYSIPFFFSPRPDARIAPIPTCVDADHPRLFQDCSAAEHMDEMFRRSYGYAPTVAA